MQIIMITKALYFRNSKILENAAKILEIFPSEEPEVMDIVFDQTCGYPKGGGQPGDEGTVESGTFFGKI